MCATCRSRGETDGGVAQRVGDVEAVRPGLHQPGGGHRRRAHRRAEPRQPGAVGQRRELPRPAPSGPARQRSSSRSGVGPRRRRAAASSTSGGQRRAGLGDRAGEAVGVGRGEQRLLVGPREVGDLVGDGPALGRVSAPARRCPRARRRRASSASPSARRSASSACPVRHAHLPERRRRCRLRPVNRTVAGPALARHPGSGRLGSRAPRRRAAVHRDRRRRPPPPATSRRAATPGCGRRRSTTTPSSRCWPPARRPSGCRSGRRSRSPSPARR